MIKVLVVDDEPRQRRILTKIIQEYRTEYEVVEAGNGREVLKRYDVMDFDLILTDIRMPQMDGLSMLEQLCERNKNLEIIIISGYDEFEYARKALSLNVSHYILKPINQEMIWDAINQAEAKIIKNRNALQEHINLSDYYRKHLILKWLGGECTDAEYRNLSDMIPKTRCNVIARLLPRKGADNESEACLEKPLKRLRDICESSGISFLSCVLDGGEGIICVIGGMESPQILTRLFKETRITQFYHVGVSRPQPDLLNNAKLCNEQASAASSCFFYQPCSDFAWYDEIEDRIRRDIRIPPKMEDMLLKTILEHTNLSLWTGQWIDSVIAGGCPPPDILIDQIRRALHRLPHQLGSMMTAQDIAVLENAINDEFSSICVSLADLKERTRACLEHVRYTVDRNRTNRVGNVIGRCIAELHENYQLDYTLSELAEKYFFNPSYFSTLFKKHTGMHFTEYIMDLRMNHAAQLLLESNDKIYQIAKKVGYQDVKYFTRIFKKKFGYTPEEYRIYITQR